MDSEAQLMAWAALFPEKGVAALTFRTVLQWMAIAVFCTLGAVVLALYRYKPQKELGVFSAVSDGADPLGSGDHSGSGGKFRLERLFSAGDSLPSRFWQVFCCAPL